MTVTHESRVLGPSEGRAGFLGILGAGAWGTALAQAIAASGHQVMLANSRGPESLRETAADLSCEAGTVAIAAPVFRADGIVGAIPVVLDSIRSRSAANAPLALNNPTTCNRVLDPRIGISRGALIH